MFSLKSLRVTVRYRHSFRECSGVKSEAGVTGDDISGQLTPGATDQDTEDTQILSLSPELASFVTETKVDSVTHKVAVSKERLRNRPPPTLWERIQSYKSGYVEKTVLLNSEVADQIVQSIVTHTRGNQDTVFLDGEGALCHIGATLKQMNTFGSVKVLEKDMELRSLHKYAKERYLDEITPIVPLNLNKIVADKFTSGSLYESPLIEHIPSTSSASEDVPSFSLVSTISHGTIKHLISQLLYRDSPFSEFYSSRPEFFFIVSPRTYFHLCLGFHEPEPVTFRISEEEMRYRVNQHPRTALMNLYNNVMFQTLFDFCLVDIIPRSAYYPWKETEEYQPFQKKTPMRKAQRIANSQTDNLMMVYARPKRTEDLGIGDQKYFSHFMYNLFKNKKKFLCSLLEEWSGGWGLLVIDLGYSMYTQVGELDANEMVNLYQQLIQMPNFGSSNFVAEAEFTFEQSLMDDEIDETEMDAYRTNFWRKLNSQK